VLHAELHSASRYVSASTAMLRAACWWPRLHRKHDADLRSSVQLLVTCAPSSRTLILSGCHTAGGTRSLLRDVSCSCPCEPRGVLLLSSSSSGGCLTWPTCSVIISRGIALYSLCQSITVSCLCVMHRGPLAQAEVLSPGRQATRYNKMMAASCALLLAPC